MSILKKIRIKVNGEWKEVSKIVNIQDCQAVEFTELMTRKEVEKHYPELKTDI